MPVRRTAVIVLLLLGGVSLAGCDRERDAARPEEQQVDPKEKELASLPVGIDVAHDPSPVKARPGGRSGRKYTWLHGTTVRSKGGRLVVQEFGAFSWDGRRWVFSTITGKPFTAQDFADWYSCPGAVLEPSKGYIDPNNYTGGDDLTAHKSKWYFIATNEKGERVKGEAVIEAVADLLR